MGSPAISAESSWASLPRGVRSDDQLPATVRGPGPLSRSASSSASVALRQHLAAEPRAGVDPRVAAAAPALVHVDALVQARPRGPARSLAQASRDPVRGGPAQ